MPYVPGSLHAYRELDLDVLVVFQDHWHVGGLHDDVSLVGRQRRRERDEQHPRDEHLHPQREAAERRPQGRAAPPRRDVRTASDSSTCRAKRTAFANDQENIPCGD